MKFLKTSSLPRTFVCFILLSAVAAASSSNASQRLRGHVPPAAQTLQPRAGLEQSKRLDLAIGLPLRNRPSLTNLLRDLYDPASPRYHHYLTAAEFAKAFGPTEQDYQAVAHFAQTHGLTVTATHPNRALLDVSGAVADLEKALHVHMRVYRHPTEPRTFYAPDVDPMIDIDIPILEINGLDNFTLPRPMDLKTAANTASNAPDFVSGSGPGGYFAGSDFRAAYAPGVTLTGAGQSVGLFELDGYFPSDVADYKILAGLPNVPITNIYLDGVNGSAGNENQEVALDIDMAMSMAPGLLQVLVYEGTMPNDVLNRMATDDAARQLSSSWGFTPTNDPVRTQIYQQFAAQGQTMFQASGDSGACQGGIFPPSDDPNLTVVGGTSLTTSGSGGAWVSETTWPGSSGGISTVFAIPSWQQALDMTANGGSTTLRNIPDVACLADILIWLIYNDGQQSPIGGTSAAAPLWAGFAALANQQAAASGQPALGFLNPALYAIGEGGGYSQAFHDITTGNNTNKSSPTNFFAVPGYDLCTGWGSPTGSNLINALASPPDSLLVTPSAPTILTGPVGGPFNPSGQTFVLTNIGALPLNWSLGGSAPWLNISGANGSLAPGGINETVMLSLNSAANALTPGNYSATIWFTNLNDRFVQRRAISLDVVAAPMIAHQPASLSIPNGATATFTVGTATNALLVFQWQFNSNNLADGGGVSGSSTSTLTVSNATSLNAGSYRVIVSNAANAAVSATATLTIAPSPPVVLTQPASQSAPQGASITFAVAVAGSAPFSYQWKSNATFLTDSGNVSGSSSSALTLANVTPATAGSYSVVVSNTLGVTPSSNAVLTVISLTAPGASLATLYTFTGGLDGANPNGLMLDTNGLFYGTTQDGGMDASGTVFQMTPDGTVTTLVLFDNKGSGGFNPEAGLTQGPDGYLYGTTAFGGTGGWGALFKTTTGGALSNIVNFNNFGDGTVPSAPLIVGSDSALYGTATFGGGGSVGTAFRVTTNGALNVLASFNYGNGAEPNQLCQAADGSFYGTALEGGANGNGLIFQIQTNGRFNNIASFNYTNGGSLPDAGLTPTPDGNFYGTTYEGGASGNGTVFEVTPLGQVTTIWSFTGGSDGAHPAAGLILGSDGNFYGTTAFGGASGAGTVFRLPPNGALVSLVQFDGFDGANPAANLVQGNDGNLYGTTQDGGADGQGTAFRVNLNYPALQITAQPAGQEAFLGANAVFSVAVTGNGPLSFQWDFNGTNLADSPGVAGSATRVLTLSSVGLPNAGVYSVVVSNAAGSILSQGASLGLITSPPQIIQQPLSQTNSYAGTAFFTVTALGDLPLSYQWQRNGTNLADGGQVSGSSTSELTITNLFETNSGTFTVLVSNAVGVQTSIGAVLTVYAVSVGGTIVDTVHGFSGTDGGVPNALFLASNGLFYGTTQNGGANNLGTIFSLSTNGDFTSLFSFAGTNGATPLASLVQGSNGLLYGTTQTGGSNAAGTIFSFGLDGTFTSLYSFATTNASDAPFTSLSFDAAGNLYGASQNNAVTGDGNIFRLGTNGQVTTVHAFSGGAGGTTPSGAPELGPDGNFYGLIATGGDPQTSGNFGAVYRMTPSGSVTNIYPFTGVLDGYAGSGQLALGDDGDFYGVTRFYHIRFGAFLVPLYGTIFKVTPTGALTTLYSMNESVVFTDGEIPVAGLLRASDGNFYGTTLQGLDINDNGAIFNNNYGIVFLITPAGQLATLTSLNYLDDGATPRAALVEGPDGRLYGATTAGGPGGHGTIYRIAFTSAPQITYQPLSQTNVIGGSAKFYVTDFGAPALFYQWQQNGVNLSDGAGIAGSSSRVLTLSNLSAAQAGTYSVLVSNALGTAASDGAALVLLGPPILQSALQTGGTFSFTWSAMAQYTYQVQSCVDLNSGVWTNFGGPIVATNTVMGASDTINPTGQKFYRVVLSP